MRAASADRAQRFLSRAETADAALRANEDRLRYRHNIELVIKRWRVAARLAKGQPALLRRAKAGEARAWALLAHWSGRRTDKETARRLQAALEAPSAGARDEAASSAAPPQAGAPAPAAADRAPTPEVARAPQAPLGPARAPAPSSAEDAPLAEQDEPSELAGDADTVDPVHGHDHHDSAHAEPAVPEDAVAAPAEVAAALRSVLEDIGVALPVEPKVRLKRSTRQAAQPRPHELLTIRRVVVDAGHGGEDHGAVAKSGLREADVNLAIAKRLGAQLKERLGVEVVYTRTDDSFVSLEERTRIANRAQADLFVSVHANAHRKRRVYGIETYYLNTTSNRYAKRLARRENRLAVHEVDADVEPEVGMADDDLGALPEGELGQDMRLLLADLAMRSATVESRRLAGYVQTSMITALRGAEYEDVKDLGVKHALFYVLLGARMPAILVETGFISHAVESERLATEDYRAHVAKAIAAGIERLASEREAAAERLAAWRTGSVSAPLAAANP